MSLDKMKLVGVLRVGVVAGALLGALVVPTSAMASGSKNDHDGDGLRNRFERLHSHTNPWKKDSDRDGIRDGKENPDHDGLTNRQEQAVGTNPVRKDSDGDGTRDAQDDKDCDSLDNRNELRVGLDARDADTDDDGIEDGDEDSDHDGVDNEDEQDDGTNPDKDDFGPRRHR